MPRSIRFLARIFHLFLLRKPGSPINTPLDSELDLDSMENTALRQTSSSALSDRTLRLSRHESNKTSGPALFLLAMVLSLVILPSLFPKSYTEPSALVLTSPSWQHCCGTDLNGRDLFYRMLTGGSISLLVGCSGALITLLVGTFYGMVAGYLGGWWDAGMTRFIDILYSIPRLIFILILIDIFNERLQQYANHLGWSWLVGSSRILILIASLGLIEWLTMARLVRGQTLSLKERPFIAAAEILGQRPLIILWRHIFPNLVGLLVVMMTLSIPAVIIDEAFLSFLGLGVQAPMSSLGSLIAEGAAVINPLKGAWWTLLFPTSLLLLLLVTLNYLGNELRESHLQQRGE